MTKKKAKQKKKPNAPPARAASFRLRMSDEFREWLDRFAAHRQQTTTDVLVHGAIALAKAEGFEQPPRR